MQIQPVHPVEVFLKCNDLETAGNLVELSEQEMILTCTEFLDRNSPVTFHAKYFWGEAIVHQINYSRYLFTYILSIEQIKYRPGLVVNTKL
ncbi:hypothetical protein [Legionella spiritensis]|uniref:Uncharacterized protein n=1 Tax=Legionella spiritensis TaxID=452 RepID=A0A0W0YWA5_LEGSP|nr:hypothetical protein [Legionella spiritensis]KTD61181.1 hypothetical protein Lspi_2801 [Legionella spiritensis]SNV28476.1 Uncharacterised protein [Legionella spiritensis]VEG91682.1 Uncharacterised protein [Legionella spiritensis]